MLLKYKFSNHILMHCMIHWFRHWFIVSFNKTDLVYVNFMCNIRWKLIFSLTDLKLALKCGTLWLISSNQVHAKWCICIGSSGKFRRFSKWSSVWSSYFATTEKAWPRVTQKYTFSLFCRHLIILACIVA